MNQIRAITAVSAPLQRMRLRALSLEPGLELVGEASSGAQAAELAFDLKPDVLLCDERIAGDPALTAFSTHQIGNRQCRIVLLAQGSRSGQSTPPIPVAATLALDASIAAIAAGLIEIARVASRPRAIRPPQIVQQLSTRFSLSDVDPAVRAVHDSSMSPHSADSTASLQQGQSQALPAATKRLGTRRRQQTSARDRLQALLDDVRYRHQDERDVVTGLPNIRVLSLALESLAGAGCPSAIIVAHLSLLETRLVTADEHEMAAILRSASAAVLANVRQEDIVCRLDGVTFSIVMPGLEHHAQVQPVLRIRAALARLQDSAMLPGIAFHVSTGSGFWMPGMRPEEPLEAAWAEMLSEREAYATRPSTER